MLSDWLFWISGGLLAAASLVLLYWALFTDRSRGRRRCPKCWYDMSGAVGDSPYRCPECGKIIKREKKLHKTHRRWRWAMLAVVLTTLGGGLCGTPSIKRAGVQSIVPSTVLILMIGRQDTPLKLIACA